MCNEFLFYGRKDRVLTDIVITVLLLCGLMLFTGIPVSAQDQEIPVMAPLNPKFVDYMNLKSVPRLSIPNVTSDGYALGYIPSPLDLSHLAGQSIFPADSLRATSMEAPLQALPASYDLRPGNVTAVRNQGQCGDCWAFATMGSAESNLLMSVGETWNFSEYNLNMNHGFVWLPCEGGNGDMSTAYFARWGAPDYQSGPINEIDDPYHPQATPPPGYTPPVSPTLRKHLQEVIIVPPRTGYSDNDNLKNAVMTYGGVMTSYYASSSYFPMGCPTGTCTTYYYSGGSFADHAVTIVGWDDNFPSSSFSPAAAHNGAFIIKNSWGTGWGDGGYFYISYDDSQLGKESNYVFNGAQPTTNYTHIYQYDPLGWTSGLGYGSTTGWFANIFTAAASEQLTAMSFYVASPSSPYEIYVYSNVSAGDPRSGSLGSTNTGTMATPGYHTITLTSPVSVTAGQSFSVVVKLTTPGYNWPIPMEYPWSGYSTGATAGAGQSFISSSGTSWSDITTLPNDPNYSNTNVCIKAFAGNDITPPTDGTLTATAGNGQVSLSWTAASDSGGLNPTNTYKVVRSTVGTPSTQCASGTQVFSGSAASKTDTGLTNGTTYYYRVCAYDNAGNLSIGATANTTLPVRITVTTSPSGLHFKLDGSDAAPQTYVWSPGEGHTIAALPSTQSGATGTQYVYSSWSDGGGQSHSIAPAADGTYTANFTTQYELTVPASTGGVVSQNCSSGCWYNSGTSAGLLANPNNGYIFGSWGGNCSGSNPSTTVLINGVKNCTASFVSCVINPTKDISSGTLYPTVGGLTGAYADALDPDTIRLLATNLSETLDLNRPIAVSLSGGWNCGFVTQTSYSIIQGLTIGNNSLAVTAENLIIY
ncbi:MAG: lectin like domain-containing protein [Thermodesulfovibrionales bacterium]